MNDTTRRFLTAIVERVPAGGEIVELRLFPAIRQGGIESAVAVVAIEPPQPEAVPDEPPDASAGIAADGAGEEREEAVYQVAAAERAEGEDAAAREASSTTDVSEAVGPAGTSDSAATFDASEPRERGEVAVEEFVLAAAHELVDTDVAIEDEEGSTGEDGVEPQDFVPMADDTDEYEVADALDDEMQTIVLKVEREYVPAESHAADASDGDERPADVVVHVEPGVVDDESPYADAPSPPDTTARPILADAPPADEALAEVIGDARAHLPSPVGGIAVVAEPADVAAPGDEETIALVDILALPAPGAEGAAGVADITPVAIVASGSAEAASVDVGAPPAPLHRYAILTARYRLVIKGPDRGKWDVELVHEADAPLDTVERVVRGVAKRAGEEQDPERFSGESLRAALAAPVWATTP